MQTSIFRLLQTLKWFLFPEVSWGVLCRPVKFKFLLIIKKKKRRENHYFMTWSTILPHSQHILTKQPCLKYHIKNVLMAKPGKKRMVPLSFCMQGLPFKTNLYSGCEADPWRKDGRCLARSMVGYRNDLALKLSTLTLKTFQSRNFDVKQMSR